MESRRQRESIFLVVAGRAVLEAEADTKEDRMFRSLAVLTAALLVTPSLVHADTGR
jgi:hypothetical protein